MNSRYRLNLKFLREAAEAAAGKDNLETQVQEFNSLLRKQIEILNHYCMIKYEELLLEIQNVARHIKRVIQLASSAETIEGMEPGIILLSSERQLFAAGDDIVALELCIRENFQLLVKAIVHFDEVLRTSASSWFIAQLTREGFANVNCDILLIALSLCWEKWRTLDAREWKTEKTAWKPPESFVRNTVKYWIRPEKVAQCKASLIRYCPYLIFGLSNSELEYLIDPYDVTVPRRGNPDEISDGQLVSSVYFDSIDGYCYSQRIKRLEGAQLLRFRWYGENREVAHRTNGIGENGNKTAYVVDPNLEIFVERKTHHESWSGLDSVKERFSLPQKRIQDFLSGKLNIDQWIAHVCAESKLSPVHKKIKNIKRLAEEITALIFDHDLRPMLRTSYLRSAFQRSDRNDIRFSLDTNLCMVNEFRDANTPGSSWCKTENDILGNNEVVRFPYAVLEVKLQTEQPFWVSKMLYDCQAIMVFKFSKFQHGFAFLHRDKLRADSPLPHWIPDFENKGYVPGLVIPSNRSAFSSALPSNGMRSQAARNMLDYKNAVYHRGKNVRKYDPKSILACERTLMHYIHKCLFVFASGLACFQYNWQFPAVIAIVSGLSCMTYSFFVYKKRLAKIVNRLTKETYRDRLDDVHAPLIATTLVAVGLISGIFIHVCELRE